MAKILIIDDDPAMRKLVTVLMRSLSHEIIEAVDGITGISLAISKTPDLIICDYHMPGVNGLDALISIRKESILKNTPVIITSTGINKQTEGVYKKLGVSYCLTKPVDIVELRTKIEQALSPNT